MYSETSILSTFCSLRTLNKQFNILTKKRYQYGINAYLQTCMHFTYFACIMTSKHACTVPCSQVHILVWSRISPKICEQSEQNASAGKQCLRPITPLHFYLIACHSPSALHLRLAKMWSRSAKRLTASEKEGLLCACPRCLTMQLAEYVTQTLVLATTEQQVTMLC